MAGQLTTDGEIVGAAATAGSIAEAIREVRIVAISGIMQRGLVNA